MRGVLPALLDAGGDDRAARGAPHPRQGARRGAGAVPRPLGAGWPPAQALQPSPGIARVRGPLRARHPVLLPRLAVRRGRHHSRGARRTGGEPHPPQALPRRLSRSGVLRPRLRLPRPPGAHARVPNARHLLAPGRRARALPHRLPLQLAAGGREPDGPVPQRVPAHPGDPRALQPRLGRDAGGGVASAGRRHRDLSHQRAPMGGLHLGAHRRGHAAGHRAAAGHLPESGPREVLSRRGHHQVDGAGRRHTLPDRRVPPFRRQSSTSTARASARRWG